MLKFWKKKQDTKAETPEAEKLDLDTFTHIDSVEDLVDEDEYTPEKDIQLLEYMISLKKEGKIQEVIVRMRSRKDVDIVAVVPDDKVKITKIFMESDFYIKKDKLKVDIVNRHRDRILVLTVDKITYEIAVIGQLEFEQMYTVNKQ